MFPGSFDPLHEGHTKLAEAALDATKKRDAEEPSLVYEISLKNADKGVIDVEQAEERLLQFKKANAAVALTRRALYVDKSQLFGPCDFVMGADALQGSSMRSTRRGRGPGGGAGHAAKGARVCGGGPARRAELRRRPRGARLGAGFAPGHGPRDPGLPRGRPSTELRARGARKVVTCCI